MQTLSCGFGWRRGEKRFGEKHLLVRVGLSWELALLLSVLMCRRRCHIIVYLKGSIRSDVGRQGNVKFETHFIHTSESFLRTVASGMIDGEFRCESKNGLRGRWNVPRRKRESFIFRSVCKKPDKIRNRSIVLHLSLIREPEMYVISSQLQTFSKVHCFFLLPY